MSSGSTLTKAGMFERVRDEEGGGVLGSLKRDGGGTTVCPEFVTSVHSLIFALCGGCPVPQLLQVHNSNNLNLKQPVSNLYLDIFTYLGPYTTPPSG